MIKDVLSQFSGKNVLLLQGPIGPFFSRLADDLESVDASVFKINFNGGDCLFYQGGAEAYTGHLDDWPEFFQQFVRTHDIDAVLLFGDCRPVHRAIHDVAIKMGVGVWVFEEGYVRPDYITMEKHGVNAKSKLPRYPDFYRSLPEEMVEDSDPVGRTFWYGAMWGMLYYAASALLHPLFRHYQHHRPLSIWQGLYWIRSLWRKHLFAYQQQGLLEHLCEHHHKKFFLAALQVHDDSQINHHSSFNNIEEFIVDVMTSFASNAPADCLLVIKHHPMDRGLKHYGKLIAELSGKHGLGGRVHYIHDLHLPTLLDHAKGVVVVNSTVGISALIHGCPVATMGQAIYDIEGITHQDGLDKFWEAASETYCVDAALFSKYLTHLIRISQINGSFYKRIENDRHASGVRWRESATDRRINVHHLSVCKR